MLQSKLTLRSALALVCTVVVLCVETSCTGIKCDPPEEPFTIEQDFTERELQSYLAMTESDRNTLRCDSYCDYWAEDEITSLDSCELEILPLQGDAPAGIAGSIQCSGYYKYTCD